MEFIYALLYAIIAVVSVALYWIKIRMSYWKNRGIPHDEPMFFFGNFKGVGTTQHIREPIRKFYKNHKGAAPFFGLQSFVSPVAVPTDLDLIRKILIKDFNNFADRGIFSNEKDDPLSGHLFAVGETMWRRLRTKLTPTFTSGKMKFMFPTVVEVGHRFAEVFAEMVSSGEVVEIKEVLARFTTDVIGTCAFGIECNSLRDPNAEFRLVGQKFLSSPRHNPIISLIIRSSPKLAKRLRMRITPDDVQDFFMGAVRETVEYREKNGIIRNDFMNMLIEIKNYKSTKTESGEVISGITMEELAAQAFVFYLGGFETSSSTMSFALYELAQHQEIQDKARKEVVDILAKHNGVLTYECMKDMKYLDQIICETLRKHSILPFLNRVAKDDYHIAGTKYTIEKDMRIFIPVDAIQHDPEIYPNPEQFDPERFSPAEVQKRDSVAWLPFGDGPRNCIGLRFGKMQTRIGLSLLLKNFIFDVCDQTKIPLEIEKETFILQAKGGIYLKVNRTL